MLGLRVDGGVVRGNCTLRFTSAVSSGCVYFEEVMMNLADLNVVSILQLGVTGLGFLLALLAYRLLSKEQSAEKTNPSILLSIRYFMGFSITLCLIGLVPQVLAAVSAPDEQEMAPLRSQIEQHQEELGDYQRIVNKLTGNLETAESNSAKAVFTGVCLNQYFQCDKRMYAESAGENYRRMSPVEQQVCNLACN